MKTITLLTITCIVASCSTALALASDSKIAKFAPGYYIEAKGGVSMPHKPKGDFQASKLKRSALA